MSNSAQAAAWEPRYAGRAARMQASEIRELLKLLDRPGIISFAGGIPDPALFPVEEAKAAYAAVLGDAALAGSGLQYSVSEGYLPLRQWIARHMATLGVPCEPDNVAHHLGLAAGAGVSRAAAAFARRHGAGDGADLSRRAAGVLGQRAALRRVAARAGQSHACFLCGSGPAERRRGEVRLRGFKLSPIRPARRFRSRARERLLDLAAELDIPIIEDAAYAMLRFEGERLPPIMALDVARSGGIDQARTIYCGTFSKVLSPGLRVGWIVAGKPLIRRLVLIKQASDLNSATINQMVMHRMAEAAFESQVEAGLRALSPPARLDAGCAGEAHARGCELDDAAGRPVRVADAFPRAAMRPSCWSGRIDEAGVAFVPGGAFFFDGRGRNTLRLSFSLAGEAEIEHGIARLAKLI